MTPEKTIFVGLCYCCFAALAFEIVKRIERTVGNNIALVIAGCYFVVVSGYAFYAGQPFLGLMLTSYALPPLALIFFADELGDLTGIRMGLVSKATPGALLNVAGWILFVAVIGYVTYGLATSGIDESDTRQAIRSAVATHE